MTSHRVERPARQQTRLHLILLLGLLVGCKDGLPLADRGTRDSEGYQEAGPRPCGPDSGTCSGLCIDGSCIGVCVPAARRCAGPIPQTCSARGQWDDGAACPHGCQEGNCAAAQDAGPEDGGRDLPPITGVTYYVSPMGLDSNPGTQSQPWKTIKKAANTLVAGEAVQILAGTYHEQVVPLNSGSPGKPITYQGAPGTAIVDGTGVALSSAGNGVGLIQLTGKSHIVVRGLTIKSAAVHGIGVATSTDVVLAENTILDTHTAAIKVYQSQNIRIRDNTIKHVLYSSGIGVWTSEHVLVDHNVIDTPHWYHECQGAHEEGLSIASVNHFEVAYNTLDYTEAPPAGYCSNAQRLGIDIKESSQDGLVHHNDVRNMDAGGIYVDGWHAGANGTPTLNHINIYQNKVSSGGGIVVGCEQADGVVEHINIYNNLVTNVRFSGIQVRGAWGDGLRKNINIYNNTVYGANPAGGHGGAGIYVTTSNLGTNNNEKPVVIRNNISNFFFLPSGGGTVGQIRAGNATQAAKVTADHNIVYGPQSCSTEYPNCVELGSRTTASPSSLYVDPAGFDLHLRPGAPAIDSGTKVPLVVVDYDGVPRPQPSGGIFDVGAFEWH